MTQEVEAKTDQQEFKTESADFWWVFNLISSASTCLALVALARHAWIKGSLVAPLELIMASYQSATTTLFGWAEPYIRDLLARVSAILPWKITLYPHWRDIFVLSFFLMSGRLRVVRRSRGLGEWTRQAVGALLGSLGGAIAVGTIALQSSSLVAQMCICGLPITFVIIGAAAFVVKGKYVVPLVLLSALAGLTAAVLTCVVMLTEKTLSYKLVGPYFGLASFVGLILFFGLLGFRTRGNDGKMVGYTIVGGFLGAALFFAVDAGLKLL